MLNHVTMFQPSAIDNAFSTIQIIHKLIKHMNKVIDEVNSIDSKANEYTDEKITEVRQEITQLNDRLQTQLTTLERQLKNYSDNNLNTAEEYTDVAVEQFKLNYVIPQLTQIRETITLIENRLDSKIDLVDVTLKNLIQETKAELLELIKKGGAIYSGHSGLLTSLQNEIYNIYNVYSRFLGLTWDTFNKFIGTYSVLYNTVSSNPEKTTQSLEKNAFIYWINAISSKNIETFSVYQENEGYPVIITITFNTNIDNLVNASNVLLNGEQLTNISTTNNSIVVNVPDKSSIDNSINYLTIRIGNTDIVSDLRFSLLNPTNKIQMTWNTLELLNTSVYSENGLTWEMVSYYFYSLWDVFVNKIIYSTEARNFIITFAGAIFDYEKSANHLNEWGSLSSGRNLLTNLINSNYISTTVKGSIN